MQRRKIIRVKRLLTEDENEGFLVQYVFRILGRICYSSGSFNKGCACFCSEETCICGHLFRSITARGNKYPDAFAFVI